MHKKYIEYSIPVQSQEQCDELNKMLEEMFGDGFKRIESTETHLDKLFDEIFDGIEEVGNEGGWYVGDGVRVKIEIEYEPENK